MGIRIDRWYKYWKLLSLSLEKNISEAINVSMIFLCVDGPASRYHSSTGVVAGEHQILKYNLDPNWINKITTFSLDKTVRFQKWFQSFFFSASAVFSISAAVGITGLVWYIRKIKSTKVVTCGVQSNENRFF